MTESECTCHGRKGLKKYCLACTARRVAAANRQWTAKRKVEGRCICCGEYLTEARKLQRKLTCEGCVTSRVLKQRKRREELLAAGLCTTCGEAKPEPGRKSCRQCLDIAIAKGGGTVAATDSRKAQDCTWRVL